MTSAAEELKAKAERLRKRSLPQIPEEDDELTPGAKAPPKVGRPRKNVDLGIVRKLAKIQCTEKEIASVVGVSVETLRLCPGFLDAYETGLEYGRKALRRRMFKQALEENNVAMQIWLSKQYLGMREPMRMEHEVGDIRLKVVYEGEPGAPAVT